jgi:hypothetical protein
MSSSIVDIIRLFASSILTTPFKVLGFFLYNILRFKCITNLWPLTKVDHQIAPIQQIRLFDELPFHKTSNQHVGLLSNPLHLVFWKLEDGGNRWSLHLEYFRKLEFWTFVVFEHVDFKIVVSLVVELFHCNIHTNQLQREVMGICCYYSQH